MDFDVLVRGGLVVDGTGRAPFPADVGVESDRITAIGPLGEATAASTIDATGLVISPGFIDVHVHSEITRLGGLDRWCGIRQGVTTELMSPDGFSWAPLAPPRSREVRDYLQVFYEDLPLGWEWPAVEDYLSVFAGGLPGNLVPQVPHLPIKVAVMGWDTRPATVEGMRDMGRLVDEWLEAGAVSFAAGLEYQPGAYSSTDELIALCRHVAHLGIPYVPHQRGYGERLPRGMGESIRIGREAGVPIHISHLSIDDGAEELLQQAQHDGVDISFDMYPYAAACTHLLMVLPEWAQSGGHSAALARIRDPEERSRLRAETASRLAERGAVRLSYVDGEDELEGRLLHELAQEAGMADIDCLLHLLSEHEGRVLAIYHWPPERDGPAILRRTLAHPLFMGASDGIFRGSRPHRRGFGTFPRIVGDAVRDGTLTLEAAVHAVTGRPAQRFSIDDRGHIHVGLGADLVVFDVETLADTTTWEAPRRQSPAIRYVLVNGEIVVEEGECTGRLPGRVLNPSRARA